MTRLCERKRFLDLGVLDESTLHIDVRELSILTVQVGGLHTTGAVKVQTRLSVDNDPNPGAWVDLLDSSGSSIVITGPGMSRAIDIIGVDDVRVVVSTIEAGMEADIIFCAWT